MPTLVIPANRFADFFAQRRTSLTWFFGSIGSTYLLTKFALSKISSIAQQSRQTSLDSENLERRFNVNLSDCQFTVLALLPTLSNQILVELDVEAISAKLSAVAAAIRAAEVAEKVRGKEENDERVRVSAEQAAVSALVRKNDEATLAAGDADARILTASPTLNPGASIFVPSSSPRLASSPSWPAALITPTPTAQTSTSPLPADDDSSGLGISIIEEATRTLPAADINERASRPVNGLDDSVLSKSWAQVVVDQEGEPKEVVVEPADDVPLAVEPSRAELWNELKILSFTRIITTLYTLTLLTLQTHVQLNLLGRSSYVTSVIASLPPSSTSASSTSAAESTSSDLEMGHSIDSIAIDADMERTYLTFSWWLLHRGWKLVADRVREAVEEVVGPVSLKENISYNELSALLAQIRSKIEVDVADSAFTFSTALFPPPTSPAELETLSAGGLSSTSICIPPSLRRLLDETADFLDSSDGILLRTLCLDKLFSTLEGSLEDVFARSATVSAPVSTMTMEGARFEDIGERRVRLASLLPKLTRGSHLVLNGMPNEYVEALEDVRELTEFSAIVYTSFDKEKLYSV